MIGGAEGIRTPGLVNASHALCQLSYSPSRFRNKWYEIDFDSVKKPSFAKTLQRLNHRLTIESDDSLNILSSKCRLFPDCFFAMLKSCDGLEKRDNGSARLTFAVCEG
jgi:hypothetical protein